MPTFEIAGKPHDLQCGINEHAAIWRVTGKNVFAGENPVAGINPGNIAQILHVMLQAKQPSLTIDSVQSELVSTRRLVDALKAITDTFNDGLEEAVKAEENPFPAASESAPSAATI